jgi:hypothetical protein
VRPSGFDGPGDYRWFCLEHIRAFNQGYDFFRGMSPEQIQRAQSPISGWESENRIPPGRRDRSGAALERLCRPA